MTTPWFDNPTTQAHGIAGEQGIDIGTPFHSQMTELLGGLVDTAKYGGFGGLVGVKTSLGEEYYLHLDSEQVKPGQQVRPGDPIGLSGGQLAGGEHPASPAFSSGPHIEYGLFKGGLFGSPAIDPTGIINAARGGNQPAAAPVGAGSLLGLPDPGQLITSLGHSLADALSAGLSDVGVFFKRQIIALAVAVVVAIVLFA